ncbi:hypothetical protein CRG98_006596 [Punica granatum]|uniref:Major facilitator superfamily (MFS) profile domain-containing protein n=1 Tax=Punica granatum TaxID=22663 RepID=A0A2I0KXA6_PUNGR|nr:hypothetical protein CRG98_006596 [Punica granatum]
MAGGGFVAQGHVGNYNGGLTAFVVITCIVAAMGGLLFGYDIGISGGVTSMDDFLMKFFPAVYHRTTDGSARDKNQYCKYDNHLLTLFTSSLYLAALVASFFASEITRVFGRKVSMFLGGLSFLIGAILNGIAMNIIVLIVGRILLGVGVGFANQSVPVYLSEMAPAKFRGALNIGFQVAITIGILVANFVNYGTAEIKGGWASEAAKKVQQPWRNMFLPRYRPQLVICSLIPFFQQITGINVIMFYAPVLFKTLGFGDKASLMSAAITGVVIVLGTFVSVATVDKFGRKALFIEGGVQMIICQIAVGVMIGSKFGLTGEGSFSKGEANFLVFLICAYVAAFSWSWGPLGWLVPSEICPLEVRSPGQAINVRVGPISEAHTSAIRLEIEIQFSRAFAEVGWGAHTRDMRLPAPSKGVDDLESGFGGRR